MIGENAIAAVLVALLTGVMLTLAIDRAVGNLWVTIGYTGPATVALAGVLFLISSDLFKIALGKFKLGGKKPPKDT
jgi:hypothetical protein